MMEQRKPTMNLDYVKYLLVLLLTIGVTDLDFHIGYPILDQQLHILIILVCLSLVLNSVLLIILGFCLFFGFPLLSENPSNYTLLIKSLSIVVIPSIIYATYKTCGTSFTCVLSAFLLYPLLGLGVSVNYFDLLSHIFIDTTAMLGMAVAIITGIVFVFVSMGKILVHSGIVDRFIFHITNHMESPARIAIMSSAIFGSVSGSAVSNVMSTGQLTIPLMLKCGYTKVRACAYEAVASTGGQLMPPVMGAAAFLMAELLMISYWEVVKVAIIPSVMFYAILLLGTPKGDTKIKVEKKSLQIPTVKEVTKDIADSMYGIIILSAAIGLIIGILDQTGLSFDISTFIIQMSNGSVPLILILTAVLCIVLGMGMPTTSTYLIVAIICAPALIESGFDELYSHLFVLYYGCLSLITPPVALASFSAAKITGANPMSVAVESIYLAWPLFLIPFIFIMM